MVGVRKPDLLVIGARGLRTWQGVTKRENTMTRFDGAVIGYGALILLLVTTVLVAWMRYSAVLEIFGQRYDCGEQATAGFEEMRCDAEV